MGRITNALAELAKRLKPKGNDCLYFLIDYGDLYKAARIVSELAKVNTLGPKHIPGDISLYAAYAKCRAIAEEGAKDGK